jgi:hypothetical protein
MIIRFYRLKLFLLGIAIISFTSCNSFSKNPLIGKWVLDSVAVPPDSLSDGNISYALLAMAASDTDKIVLEFKKDTIYTIQDGYVTEESPWKFDRWKNEMVITDSSSQHYRYKRVNDSLVTLTDKANGVLYLIPAKP